MNDAAKILYVSDMPADVVLNAAEHNYLKLISAHVPKNLIAQGVYITHVAHDDWCAIYKLGTCNCKPDISIENIQTGQIVFALRWRKRNKYGR